MSTKVMTAEELVGRMERMPFSKLHKKVFTLTAAGYLFDAFDIMLLSFVMPAMAKDLGMTPVQIGFAFSISFLGMFVGALGGGILADKFGRLTMFKVTLLSFSIATFATGFIQSYEMLLVMRLITGLGMGAEQPVVFTYNSEMMPSEYRGRLNGLVEALWGGGVLTAAGVALWLVPTYGWRAAFFSGVVPALLIWFLRKGIPESPRWFMVKGDPKAAEAQLVMMEQEIEQEMGQKLPEPQPVAKINTESGNKMAVIFKPNYIRRTMMLWILWFCLMFGYWGLNTWLPTLLKNMGYSTFASIGYVLVMNLVWIPSGLLGSYLADKIGRKLPITVYLIMAGITGVLYGYALTHKLPVEMMLACGSLSVFFLAGAYSVVYAYTPENYPTEVRGTGTGTAMSWGRIGGILAPTVVGFLYPLIGLYMTLTIVSLGFVLAALSVAFLGTETKGKNLEACSPDNPAACEPGAAD